MSEKDNNELGTCVAERDTTMELIKLRELKEEVSRLVDNMDAAYGPIFNYTGARTLEGCERVRIVEEQLQRTRYVLADLEPCRSRTRR